MPYPTLTLSLSLTTYLPYLDPYLDFRAVDPYGTSEVTVVFNVISPTIVVLGAPTATNANLRVINPTAPTPFRLFNTNKITFFKSIDTDNLPGAAEFLWYRSLPFITAP